MVAAVIIIVYLILDLATLVPAVIIIVYLILATLVPATLVFEPVASYRVENLTRLFSRRAPVTQRAHDCHRSQPATRHW